MTMTEAPLLAATAPEVVGELAAAALLAAPGLRVEAIGPDDAAPLVPAGARGVGVDIAGGGHVVVAVAPALARQVQVGPPPAEDLLEALGPVVLAVAQGIGAEPAGSPVECPVEAVAPGPDDVLVGARLHDEEGPIATIAVVVPAPAEPAPEQPAPHEFAPVPAAAAPLGATGLEVLHDVTLGVTAELGRARMLVRDVLGLAPGSVIELDRAAGSPVDVLVNGTLIARGEVVVIDEEFGIRITEVIGYAEGPGR